MNLTVQFTNSLLNIIIADLVMQRLEARWYGLAILFRFVVVTLMIFLL